MQDSRTQENFDPANVRITAAGLIWICAIQFFVAQVVVQAAWTTPFSLADNYISDLGNTVCANYPVGGTAYVCSPLYMLMNMSFYLQGVIIINGTLLIAPFVAGDIAKKTAVLLLLLTGIGMLGVGIFTEDLNNDWHVYSAALQFITGNLALMIVGIAGLGKDKAWYRIGSVTFGLVGLAATALFPYGYHFGLGVGGMERVAAYTFPVWLIISGFLIVIEVRRRR